MTIKNESNMQQIIEEIIPPEEMEPKTIDDVVELPSFMEKIAELEAIQGKPFSEIEEDIQNKLVFRRVQQMVNILKVNPLWKERIENSGITGTPQNFEEWQQLPITDRETLNEFYMGKRPGLVVPLTYSGFEIIASGGTSGGLPIETVYTLRELNDTYQMSGEFMDRYVLRNYLNQEEIKWIITTLSDYEMWSSGTMIGGILQRTPNVNYVAAGPMGQIVYNHILSFEGDKAIMGMSREIEQLIELGSKSDQKARDSFKLAIYGSGVIQARKVAELQELYPDLQILSYFASNQAEAIGMQMTPDSYLAAVPGLHLIEIVDDNGKWVKEGEEGELVITRLHATEAPILRMKLGDRMIRRPSLQGNGLKSQQMEFSGRSGDIVHLGETHYGAPLVYAALCRELKEANILDLDVLAHEIQFLNNRKEKKLYLLVTVDNAKDAAAALNKPGAKSAREFFVSALKQAISLYDQTEKQFESLDNIVYEFEIKPVEQGSEEIYRTKVNKVPLIKDVF